MKKVIIILLMMALFAPSFTQDAPAVAVERNVLKVNTLALVIGSGSVFYERKFTDLTAGQLGFGFLNYKIQLKKIFKLDFW